MSKLPKPCPIPGCGGEGEETGSYTTCKKSDCAFRTFTFHWQSLPRLSDNARVWLTCGWPLTGVRAFRSGPSETDDDRYHPVFSRYVEIEEWSDE